MHEYKTAKKRLFELQTADDVCIFCDDFPEIADLLQECQAQKIPYSSSSSSLPINYQPAQIIATKLFGIGEENVTDALATVQSLPGRLEKVGTYSDITFYDDALATIPEATMLALDMLGDDVETLIVGGHERGQNFDTLAKKIAQSSVQTLITLSPTGKRIGETVHDLADRKIHIFAANSMEEIIHLAFDHTAKGKIVLLSTAAPSFGIFKDYTDRSEQYRTWIETLSKTA
jgi:UDP-N-acetylmuramoylalanine--D-glutamate ligase